MIATTKVIKETKPKKRRQLRMSTNSAGSSERKVQAWGNLSHPSYESPVVLLTGTKVLLPYAAVP